MIMLLYLKNRLDRKILILKIPQLAQFVKKVEYDSCSKYIFNK